MSNHNNQRGFTLVELVMVIVIMGVIAGMVTVFMKSPIDAYIASGRRAAMTDVADTVVRRMARDIHKALPNSLRLPTSGTTCIEFIPTKTGGRYRAEAPGDMLDFTSASGDTSFEVFGDMGTTVIPPDQRVTANDIVAVYNLGIPGSDAYSGDNLALVRTPTPGAVTSTFTITADLSGVTNIGKQFPLASGSNRFHVIPANEQVVSYVCAGVGLPVGGDGPGTLYRITSSLATAGSTFSSCPAPVTGSAGTSVLANNVSTCSFTYDAASQRNAIVQMTLGLTRSDETVTLYHEIHVDNTP